MTSHLRRATFLLALLVAWTTQAAAFAKRSVHMATGVKIGEVDHQGAIVWTRLTRNPEPLGNGVAFKRRDGRDATQDLKLKTRRGYTPGAAGEVRVWWWLDGESAKRTATPWRRVDPNRDHTCQPRLKNLASGRRYNLLVEGRADESDDSPCQLSATFRTAPARQHAGEVSFTVITGQDFHRRDDPQNGHKIYPVMQKLDPDFLVNTGDIVYYDREYPLAKTEAAARFKWQRVYSLPFQRDFHNNVACYFMKDDHDTIKDDCWPGQKYGQLTFARGAELFREQTPMGDKTYRTIRWGKDMQIWLVEGRDFRSANPDPDSPGKTIWGEEQKRWFYDTVKASDATFRVLVSPTPMVGPDRPKKRDNHSNANFQHEGKELRRFIASQKNMLVICGDRHWQYVSADPGSGLREYSCGPTTDAHAAGFAEADRSDMHQYLRIKGGFLHVKIDRQDGKPRATLRHYGVEGKVHHEQTRLAE